MARLVPHFRLASLSPSPWTAISLPLVAGLLLAGCVTDLTGTSTSGSDGGDDTAPADDDDEPGPVDPGDDDDDDDDDVSVPAFAPKSGEWVVISADLTLDECGLEEWNDRGQPGSLLQLDNTGELTFEMTFGEGENEVTGGGEVASCSLDEDSWSYECDPIPDSRDLNEEFNLNAIVPILLSTSGDFSTETLGTLHTSVDLDCEGDDCYLVELLLGTSFPCTMVNEAVVEPSP